ncbi:unnamed protein product [Cochlearia groenlandica]
MKRSINQVVGCSSSVNTLDSSIFKKHIFLTKSQREELALKRGQDEEITEQRIRREQICGSTLVTQQQESNGDLEREREKVVDAIKEQYLGGGNKKPKKKRVFIRPSGDKFRFSLDWENTEDTSTDMNALYQNPHEAQILFGRGFRGGMDRRLQALESDARRDLQ